MLLICFLMFEINRETDFVHVHIVRGIPPIIWNKNVLLVRVL
jgi:hypothetical protein